MQYKDYYKILGVERGASAEEVKRAYKKLARKFHPDVSKERDAESRFKEVNEAYHVLRDQEKRKAYDQLGSQWQQGEEFRPPPGWEGHVYSRSVGPEEFDLGGFSDFFSSLFGAGGRGGFHFEQRDLRRRGDDLRATIHITLEDAFHGTTRTLNMAVPQIDTEGHVTTQNRQLNVHIPRGVCAGQHIRLAGQGGKGIGGGGDGDLFLRVEFEPHPQFHAEGHDIFLELPITPWEAALGARIKVPTLGGAVELQIPEGSQSGRRLRLQGRGLPGRSAGDQYVVLRIETPPADSEASRDFYRHMAKSFHFNPRHDRGG